MTLCGSWAHENTASAWPLAGRPLVERCLALNSDMQQPPPRGTHYPLPVRKKRDAADSFAPWRQVAFPPFEANAQETSHVTNCSMSSAGSAFIIMST